MKKIQINMHLYIIIFTEQIQSEVHMSNFLTWLHKSRKAL